MRSYFAGGCFWCVTPVYKMYGVEDVICGYSGGDEENPTYEDVKAQKTGHRETIMLTYDPAKVSYEKLLDIYFANIDPFDGEGQFIDRGFSYTPAIFYSDDTEKTLAEKKIEELEDESGKEVKAKVKVSVRDAVNLTPRCREAESAEVFGDAFGTGSGAVPQIDHNLRDLCLSATLREI